MMRQVDSDTVDRPDVTSVVEVLGESYVLKILDAAAETALSAKEIAREADVPSTTMYRRLDSLTDVGLIEESMQLDDDGDHYHVYQTALEELNLTRQDGGLQVVLDVHDDSGSTLPGPDESVSVV